MLAGTVLDGATDSGLPTALRRMLSALADPALVTAPLGRHDVDGDDMFIVLREYETTAAAATLGPETHRLYCDVQVVLDGLELIGWAPATPSAVARGYDPAKDISFYDDVVALEWLRAEPGCFHLFTPQDIHMPGVSLDRPRHVRKAVGKVLWRLLADEISPLEP